MRRREFIAATAALLASPWHSRAQGKPRRIGFLGNFEYRPILDVWRNSLRDNGSIEGNNLLVEYRYAQPPDRMPALATELITLTPDLVIASGPQAAVALNRQLPPFQLYSWLCSIPWGWASSKPIASKRQYHGSCDLRARKLGRKTNRNPPRNCSFRLENCDLGQSGQSNAPVDTCRGGARHSSEPRRGFANSGGDHGPGTGHRVCLGRRPAR